MKMLKNEDFSPNSVKARINELISKSELKQYACDEISVSSYPPHNASIVFTHKPSGGILMYQLNHAELSVLEDIYEMLMGDGAFGYDFDANFGNIVKYIPQEKKTVTVIEDLRSRDPLLPDGRLLAIKYDDNVWYASPGFIQSIDFGNSSVEDADLHDYNFFHLVCDGEPIEDADELEELDTLDEIEDLTGAYECTKISGTSRQKMSEFFVEEICQLVQKACQQVNDGKYINYGDGHNLTQFYQVLDAFIDGNFTCFDDTFLVDEDDDADLDDSLYAETEDLIDDAIALKTQFTPSKIKKFTKKLAKKLDCETVYNKFFGENEKSAL